MKHKFELNENEARHYCGFNYDMLSIAKKVVDGLNDCGVSEFYPLDYNSIEKAVEDACKIELIDKDCQWELVKFYSESPDEVMVFYDAKTDFINDIMSCIEF